MSVKPTILLTGAAGNVGRLLTPFLSESFTLRLTDLKDGDLADPAFAREVVSGCDGVVHLAGLVASEVSFEDTLNGNYRALISLLEACRYEGVKRFVFASSHHIVGLYPSDRTLDESAIPVPDSFYGLSKAFGEAACAMYAMRFGISTLVIRIGNADPQVSDARRERLWISGRDLAQLVTIGLTTELSYEIVYGVSNCPNGLFQNEVAERLGYKPLDRSEENRAPDFRNEDSTGLVGGRFATDPLPTIAAERRREPS